MNPRIRRTLAPLLSLLLSFSAGHVMAQNSYKVEVVINGKPIVSSEVRDAINAQEQLLRITEREPLALQRKLKELKANALNSLIERQLILSEFDKLGGSIRAQYIDDDINGIIRDNFDNDRQKFLHELTRSGLSLRKFRKQREEVMVISVLRNRQVKSIPPPTPEQVNQFYKKNIDQFREKDYMQFSTITIPKYPIGTDATTPEQQLKLAQEIRTKAVSGSNFADLARTYSQDSRASEGGDWGMQERGNLNQELANVAFTLQRGQVSNVIEISSNYMIIYCEAKQPGAATPLEKVRSQVERAIKNEMSREAINRWTATLASRSSIQPDNVRNNFMTWLSNGRK